MKKQIFAHQLLWFSIAVIIITTVPYLMAFGRQNDQYAFSGFLLGVDDGNSYIAKMLLGQQGDWLFKSPYSATEQTGIIAFLPYILLGKLASPPALHDQLVVLFHLFRIAGIGIFVWGTHKFIQRIIIEKHFQLLALSIATLGGGLGWILLFLGFPKTYMQMPLEFYSPETFGFLSVFSLPHMAFSRGLMLAAIAEYDILINRSDGQKNVLTQVVSCSVLLLLTGIFQPLSAALGILVIGIMTLVKILREKLFKVNSFGHVIIQFFFSTLGAWIWVGYMLWLSAYDLYFKQWTSQNIISSPSILFYVMGYGLFILLIILNYRKLRIENNSNFVIACLIWIAIVPILVYAPYNLQRRLAEGVWPALVALSLLAINGFSLKIKVGFSIGLLALSLPSTILILFGGVTQAIQPNSPIFVERDKVLAYEYFDADPSRPTVLAGFRESNELPAWAPVRVITGHGPESIHANDVNADVEVLLRQNQSEETYKNILFKYKIDYLLLSKDSSEYLSWMQNSSCNQQVSYENAQVIIFQLMDCR